MATLDPGFKALLRTPTGAVFARQGRMSSRLTTRLFGNQLLYLGHGGVQGQPGHNPRAAMLVTLIVALSLTAGLTIGQCQIFDVGCDNGRAGQAAWHKGGSNSKGS